MVPKLQYIENHAGNGSYEAPHRHNDRGHRGHCEQSQVLVVKRYRYICVLAIARRRCHRVHSLPKVSLEATPGVMLVRCRLVRYDELRLYLVVNMAETRQKLISRISSSNSLKAGQIHMNIQHIEESVIGQLSSLPEMSVVYMHVIARIKQAGATANRSSWERPQPRNALVYFRRGLRACSPVVKTA
jgi:hypothetical protein